MKKRTFLVTVLLLIICVVFLSSIYSPVTVSAVDMELSSEAALLMEYDTGEIIFNRSIHEKLYPASTTKIMTLLLALEAINSGKISLEDQIPVTEHAASMGGTQLFLSPGDVVDLESLLMGITVGSANDASVAVAEYIAGSEESFVEQMNKRAEELGAENTNFLNPTGLHHDEHYSTAYDLSLMTRELLYYPLFFRWSTIWMNENFLEDKIKSGKVYLSNTNRLVRIYNGCDGVKTGFTNEAGHSIVASAERDGTRFIATVLKAPSSEERYNDAARLLDHGFNNYNSIHIADKNEIVATVPVEKGSTQKVDIVTEEKLTFLMEIEEEVEYDIEISCPDKLAPPVYSDVTIGEMKIIRGDKVEKSTGLKPVKDIDKASFPELFLRYFKKWIQFGR